jgi:hypothetical protein
MLARARKADIKVTRPMRANYRRASVVRRAFVEQCGAIFTMCRLHATGHARELSAQRVNRFALLGNDIRELMRKLL